MVSIRGQQVVLEQADAMIRIPFAQWNELIEQVGHREPQADRCCPP